MSPKFQPRYFCCNCLQILDSSLLVNIIRDFVRLTSNIGTIQSLSHCQVTFAIVASHNLILILCIWCNPDRCEAYSTYPRTYDLLHAWTVFSDIERKGCSAVDLMIEMDRIVRPKGFIIVRDKPKVVEYVKKYMKALHWEAVATADAEQDEDDAVFIIQKKIWRTSESFRDLE